MHHQNPVDAPPESRGTTSIRCTTTESCLYFHRENYNTCGLVNLMNSYELRYIWRCLCLIYANQVIKDIPKNVHNSRFVVFCCCFLSVECLYILLLRLLHWIGIVVQLHDDVIKWNNFLRYWPFLRGNHRSPLVFSLIWAWTNGWANHRDAGDLRSHRSCYDATVMASERTMTDMGKCITWWNLIVYNPDKTKHNKPVFVFYGINCMHVVITAALTVSVFQINQRRWY